MDGDILKMKVAELKIELSKVGAKVTGRKHDLAERLQAYRRNSNFSGQSFQLPEQSCMPPWPSAFHSMTMDDWPIMPSIGQAQIETYVLHHQAFANQPLGDQASLSKARKMTENSIQALSIHKDGNTSYFSGIVEKSMKKLHYNIKIVIQQNGKITCSECECPAGKGPHSTCKHVCSCLLAISEFVSNKIILIKKSCTEELQSFKKPRQSHGGAPMKIAELGDQSALFLHDPRPIQFRKRPAYNDEVRSNIINFCATSSANLAMLSAYSSANECAAQAEHDYSVLRSAEY